MNLSVISRHIGSILLLNASLMVLSAVVSVCYGVDTAFSPLLLSAVITGVTGSFPLIFVRKNADLSTREGYAVLFFAWALSCLFGMLPYVLWGGEFTLINAWYESVSGYTTTGGTILTEIESLPKGLLFWRSSTHWIGGMGVVLLMLMVLPEVGAARMRLSKMEISSLSKDNYRFRIQRTLRVIASVYFGITIAATICLALAGMDLFDAVNHAFSTVATGGFSTRNQSILFYNSPVIEAVLMIFMMLSGMHFGLIYLAATGKSMNLFRSPVIRYYVASLVLCGILVALNLRFAAEGYTFLEALRYGMFQAVSMGTTTGFATANSAVWPAFSMFLLIFLSIQCGCSGSTSGGVKADRFLIFWSSIGAQMRRQLHPKAYIPMRLGNTSLEPDAVASVNLFIVFYLLLVLFIAFILSFFGQNFLDSFSSSVSHMSNAGPGFGSVGSMGNYAHFTAMSKFTLTVEMLLGRLEIYGFLMIFFINKWR